MQQQKKNLTNEVNRNGENNTQQRGKNTTLEQTVNKNTIVKTMAQ